MSRQRSHNQSLILSSQSAQSLFWHAVGENIVIDVDVRTQFNAILGNSSAMLPTGINLARKRLLAAQGITVISVPTYIWDKLGMNEKKPQIIQEKKSHLLQVGLQTFVAPL